MKRSPRTLGLLSGLFILSGLLFAQARTTVQPPTKPSLPAGIQQDWWSQVQANIQAQEYHFTVQDSVLPEGRTAYQAPNRAQGFRTAFTGEGVTVTPMREEGQRWEWGLSLAQPPVDSSQHPVARVNTHKMPAAGYRLPATIEGNRIAFDHGWITEWFINTPDGLEQGFTIPAPLPEAGSRKLEAGGGGDSELRTPNSELHLDMMLTGNLHPKFSDDGQAVDFYADGSVSVLRYDKLKVTDAAGRILPSYFEGWVGEAGYQLPAASYGVGGGIRIVIDAHGAVYPITVDPILTTPAWTAEGDLDYASFGFSVCTAGDVNGDGYSDVIVGARDYNNGETHEGRAYLFLGGASGLSTLPAWMYESNQAWAYFGDSVATAGDVNGDGYNDVIVGAYWYDNGEINEGRAFVFHGGPSGLTANPVWTAESNQAESNFAGTVATAGDVNGDGYSDVIIGANFYDNGETTEGRAYVYHGGPSGLELTPAWIAEGNQNSIQFGGSVATAGDVNGDGYADVIVGAHNYNNGEDQEGRAYVFHGGPYGLASTPAWTVESNQADCLFGNSVATAGDVNGDGYGDVLVGAIYYDNGQNDEGAAFLYLGSASGLSAAPSLMLEGDQADGRFGSAVASAGDVNGDGYADVIIGAYVYDVGAANDGVAFLYFGGPSGLSTSIGWFGYGNQADSNYGISVATAGDVNGDGYSDIIVGADGYDNGQDAEGRAFLYLGGAYGPTIANPWTATGEASSRFGMTVASAGDVNGDGYGDVLVGAYIHNSSAGKAYLYPGTPSGLSTTEAWSAAGEGANHYFGWFLGSAGDVNGDGYGDVAVSANGYDSSRGKVYLYYGSSAGLLTTPAWTATGELTSNNFGSGLASAGDINGDGYGDLAVGAYGHTSNTGKAYVYHGGPAGLSYAAAWTAVGQGTTAYFGNSLGSAGDVNADGYGDLVVGAWGHDEGATTNVGKAYLYLGSSTGLSASAVWTALGEAANNIYGASVARAGDVNGDGYADVLIGAEGYNSTQGKAYLYLGKSYGLAATTAWTALGEAGTGRFGTCASAGDTDGDGYADIVIGARYYTMTYTNRGKIYFYRGSASGPEASASWTAAGEAANNYFGVSVASARDVNGDGFSDILVGAYGYSTNTGRAYVYYGGGGKGMPTGLRQMRADASAPIAPGGLAHERAFRLGMATRSPSGVTTARFQYQTAPLGGTFKPWLNPVQSHATWWDSVGAGAFRTIPMTLADAPAAYAWRARLQYNPVTSPFHPHSPWFTLSANGVRETDLISTDAPLPDPPGPCVVPDEPVWLYSVVKNGTDYTLNFQDPNQADQRTGWNIRRSNDPIPPKDTWPIEASNVVDMDAGTANYQWTDHSGDDPSPSAIWYYQVTAYNADCPAEGPF